ncbi:recombinase RecT [Alicyclobacillus fastidiosus]|uniref:Recombinase RecT n=1 Tax=Alicyclobacillus fastidiosus TaxID=392011 RepID=A0ABV5ALQ2_9BACL|nr:recombinase RecT [Alicyclobacillus fastidiosus]WEH08510.1 recombinase RecT [Alicyclobacillus fastidiosus]
MGNPSALKGQLQKRAEEGIKPSSSQGGSRSIEEWFQNMKPALAQVLPKHITADRLVRIALTEIRTNPTLKQCNPSSLMAGVLQAAQLGLEIGMLGHAYLVPFRNNKQQRMDAQMIIGYKGMLELVRRSDRISNAVARPVYENDYFHLKYGFKDEFEHVPWYMRDDAEFTDGGKLKGAYFKAEMKDGGYYFNYLPVQKIEEHRLSSKAKNSGPWVDNYEEMCLKTVVRASFKWLPVSIEVQAAVVQDETVKTDILDDMTLVPDVIDVESEDVTYESQGSPEDVTQDDAEQQSLNFE